MASGTLKGTFTGVAQSIAYPELKWSSSKDVANNRSTVTLTLYYVKVNSAWQSNNSSHPVYLQINGTNTGTKKAFDLRNTSRQTIWSRSQTVNHNADGTKSCNFGCSGETGTSLGTFAFGGAAKLDTIPRASSLSVSPSTVNYGNKVTFKISRASSSFTHTLRYGFSTGSGTIVSKTTATSYTWTVPLSLIKSDASNSWGTIYVDTYSGSTKIGEKSVRLNTNVPGASSITISPSSIDYGGKATFAISRANSAFTHTLRYSLNGASGTITSKTTSTSPTWTVPASLMTEVTTATTSSGTIYVDTYYGSIKIGSKSAKINTKIPSNIVPSFSIGISETNTKITNVIGSQSGTGGTYLKTISRIKFAINNAKGNQGSTIKSYSISFNGSSWTTSSATTGAITKSGSIPVTCKITDSRGRSKSLSATIKITDYNPPKLTTVSADRVNQESTQVAVKRTATFSQVLGKNHMKLYFDYKTSSGATSWTNFAALNKVSTGNVTSFTSNGTTTGIFSITQTYPVRVNATDAFGQTATWTGQVKTAAVVMSWGKTGVGAGKIWEAGSLDLAESIYCGGTKILSRGGGNGNTDLDCPSNANISLGYGSRGTGQLSFFKPVNLNGYEVASDIDMRSRTLRSSRIAVNPAWGTFQINTDQENGIPRLVLSNSGSRFSIEQKNSNAEELHVGGDGNPRVWFRSLYNRTYSYAANMYITSANTLGRITSASKYKLNISEIENIDLLGDRLLTINPKGWYDKTQTEFFADELTTGVKKTEDAVVIKRRHGLIAEDLRDAGLEAYVSYNEETGEIEGIEYDRLWTVLIPVIRRMNEKIVEQQGINARLNQEIKALKEGETK